MMKPLWNHQVHAIRVADVLPDLGLLFEMGTGKTRTLIEILRRQFAKAGRLQKTIIFAPIVVCPNWKQEFGMYSKINPNDIVVLTGPGKRRVKDFIKAVGEDLSRNKIVVTNYEATEMEDLYKLFLAWGIEVLVCDESQRLKDPQSVRANNVCKLADRSQHNYILTGTPILNSAMDLYMQYRILDRGETFGKNFFSFRAKYFKDENAGMNKKVHFPSWVPQMNTYMELQSKIKTKSLRVLKKDCLDLPPVTIVKREIEMGTEQARMYKEMLYEYITFIESQSELPRAVVANLAVVKALRLQQIVSGFAKDEHGVVHQLPDVPRLKELSSLLKEITPENKVIVWASFKENYKMIGAVCDKLGIKYVTLTGDDSARDKDENIKAFRTDPNIKVIVANQSAGGVGVNLIEAAYAIYYSKGFSLEADLQSAARNHRGGSEMHTNITRIDLVCPGTIDELVNEALQRKEDIGRQILGWKERM